MCTHVTNGIADEVLCCYEVISMCGVTYIHYLGVLCTGKREFIVHTYQR